MPGVPGAEPADRPAQLLATAMAGLARAVKVRLPGQDQALLAEAVRSRVRNGLLLLDDLQCADPATLAALPAIAAHCRIAVTLRTPYQIPAEPLRTVATAWLTIPPLTPTEAAALVTRVAPGLPAGTVNEVVRRAGGVPLAVEALARHAATSGGELSGGTDGLAYAVATALADLTRPARTAMAARGLVSNKR